MLKILTTNINIRILLVHILNLRSWLEVIKLRHAIIKSVTKSKHGNCYSLIYP